MSNHYDNVSQTVSAVAAGAGGAGTGVITLSTASTGSRTLATANGGINDTVDVFITSGAAWDVATSCTYTHGTLALTRGTFKSSSTGAVLALDIGGVGVVVRVAPSAGSGRRWDASALEHVVGPDAATPLAVNTLAVVDGAGLTAARTYTLPAVSQVGDRCGVVLSSATTNFDYGTSLTATGGDTLNGVAGGTIWKRLSKSHDSVIMRCTEANAKWVVESANLGVDVPYAMAERYGVHYNATAAQNVARINLALQENKVVTLTTPGQYLFGGAGQQGIKVPANRTLILPHGNSVEMILADATYEPLLQAERQFNAGTAAVGSIAYVGGGWGFRGTISATNIDVLHPVGSWIAVLGLDLSNQNNRTYQGIYQVTATAAGSITYEMIEIPPSGGNSTSGAIVYPVDTGIRIFGGMWDGNGLNNGQGGGNPYYQGDPHTHILSFRNVQNLIVEGLQFRRGYSWSIGTNNIRDCTFRDLYADLYTDGLGTANAIFQGSGGGRNVLIDGVTGTCEDNMVAWSLDTIGVQPGFTAWTYTDHWNGDVYGLRIKNVQSGANNAAIVSIWGNINARYHDLTIDNISGRCNSPGVAIDNGFWQTGMLNTTGGTLKISNIDIASNASPVVIRSNGTWDHIMIDGVRMRRATTISTPAVQFSRRENTGNGISAPIVNGTTQVIKRVDIKNLSYHNAGSDPSRTGPHVEIGDSTINTLTVSDFTPVNLNANTGIVNFIGTLGTVSNAVVSNLHGTVVGAFSDACLVRCANTNAGALGTLVVRDSRFTGLNTGGADRGGLVHQTGTGKVAKVRLDNTPVPAVVKAGHVSGVIRDGTGLTIDTVNVTTT